MKTAAKITICALAASVLMFFVGWESLVIYGQHIGFQDATVQRTVLTFVASGIAATGFLAWGFYRLLR